MGEAEDRVQDAEVQDPELMSLLTSLGEGETPQQPARPAASAAPSGPEPDPVPEPSPTPESDPLELLPAPEPAAVAALAAPAPSQIDTPATVRGAAAGAAAGAEVPLPDDLKGIVDNFNFVRDEIFQNYKSDRAQAEEAIQRFIRAMESGEATQAIVEGYVQSLRIKTDINANAIGMLDAIARFLAAGKGSNLFVQQVGIDPKELMTVLNAAPYPDEARPRS
jgi:hypothetical protein